MNREGLIAAVASEWGRVTAEAKCDLMDKTPDLYWAVARLAAMESARRDVARLNARR